MTRGGRKLDGEQHGCKELVRPDLGIAIGTTLLRRPWNDRRDGSELVSAHLGAFAGSKSTHRLTAWASGQGLLIPYGKK